MPALFPPCYILSEVGPVVISGEKRENLLAISADGVFHCVHYGIDCPFDDGSIDHNKKVSLEIKCPFNCNNPYTDMLYTLPKMYVPQITSQMFAFKSEFGILATKSENSVIVKRITNDEGIWSDQTQILLDFYDKECLKKPAKFHAERKEVLNKINFFSEHNFTVLMEVPELCAFDSFCTQRDGSTPFRERVNLSVNGFNREKFSEELNVTLAESLCVLQDAHNICRRKASEILLFMISDSDRLKLLNDDTYTHVIGYGMKGYSLPVDVLREMLEFLRNILKDYKIPVLCESFDGQWANLAFKDINGEPLTVYHLLAKSWEQARNLSRRNIMLKLRNISHIQPEDLVTICQQLTYGAKSAESGNLSAQVLINNDGENYFCINSKGGHLNQDMLLCHASLSKVKNINESSVQLHECDLKTKNKLTGIFHEDMDIVSTFDPTLVKDIINDMESTPNFAGIHLEDFLNSPRLQLLTKLINHLQTHGKSPLWKTYTEDDIFPHILMYKDKIMSYSKHDIDLMVKVIEKNTIRKIFTSKDTKDIRAAKIAFLFGSGELIYNTPQQVPSLRNIAQNCVEKFPLLVLQAAYAGLVHVKNKREWHTRKTIKMEAYIPIVKDFVPLFYFPEYSQKRQQIEVRTLDYTHQLTNLRGIICRSGIQNVKKSEFVRISNLFPNILSKGIVQGELDAQCASLAIELFSEKVEVKLIENNAMEEALFVKLVRNWYKACDERGMSADDRINNLWAFYAYLTKDINFDKFPGYSQYIKGIPVITYTGILQNISVRMSLYEISKFKTYNPRSISSLVCESFFSTISSRDPGKTGCPKAVDVPKIMSDMITIEEYKQLTLRYV